MIEALRYLFIFFRLVVGFKFMLKTGGGDISLSCYRYLAAKYCLCSVVTKIITCKQGRREPMRAPGYSIAPGPSEQSIF